MKRLVIVLLISLLNPILGFSQNSYPIHSDSTVVITAAQLKRINLIFNEHSQLQEENNVYKNLVRQYDEKIQVMDNIDSLRSVKLQICTDSINKQANTIKSLKRKSKQKSVLSIVLGTLAATFGTLWILK